MTLVTNLQTTSVVPSVSVQGAYEPFDLQVSRNQIANHASVFIFGYQAAVDSTQIPIWENATTYTYPTSASTLTLVSDSASDDTTASVLINGLDANFNIITETINLNGTTGVTTVNSYLRINGLVLQTAGTGQIHNIGTITLSQGSNVLAQINPTISKSQASIFTVPANYTFYLYTADINTGAGYTGDYTTYQVQAIDNANGGVERNILQQPFTSLFTADRTATPFAYIEKMDIQFQCSFSGGSTIPVGLIVTGKLIKNNGML